MSLLRSSLLLAGLAAAAVACSSANDGAASADEALSAATFDWRNASFYYVVADRFNDGDPSNNCLVAGVSSSAVDYRGGDWAGITAKIREGYFTNLGINALMLSIPAENPNRAQRGGGGDTHMYSAYNGYWAVLDHDDPRQLDAESCFGTLADLAALVTAAHDQGLKVVFDYAPYDLHSDSQLYEQHPDWFFPNAKDGHDCVCGSGCAWDTDQNRCWLADYLPRFDFTNEAARKWAVNHAVAWATQVHDPNGRGADGYRLEGFGLDDAFLADLRSQLRWTDADTAAQRFYLLGYTYDYTRDGVKRQIDPATKLDGQFDFPLRKQIVDSVLLHRAPMTDLAAFMDANDAAYGPNAVMTTFLGGPDMPRSIHFAESSPPWSAAYDGGGDRAWSEQPSAVTETAAFERLANAYAVLFTNHGAPLVYYGDEIGMPGAGSPDNQRFMQWGGYTANQSFLKDRLARLSAIRAAHPALRHGKRKTLTATSQVWTYLATADNDEVFVAINDSDAPAQVSVAPGQLYESITDQIVDASGTNWQPPSVVIPPRQTRIYTRR